MAHIGQKVGLHFDGMLHLEFSSVGGVFSEGYV